MKKIMTPVIYPVLVLLVSVSIVQGGWFDWEKAVSLYKQGQFAEAIVEFERVVAEYPDHSDSWKFIGLSYYQLKKYAESIAPLEKALELKRKEGRNDPDLIRALGQGHLSISQYDKALPYFETLARMQMSVAANFYMLGVTYANLNRPEDSAEAFRKAVKLDPKDYDSWYYLGLQFYRSGRMPEAVTALRKGLESAPKNPEILGLLAESLLRQGAAETDEQKAQAAYEDAIKVATTLKNVSSNSETNELLGRAYLAAKKYTNAEMTLARALETSKQPTATLYFNLGFAHAQNKSWARAADMLARADGMNPGDLNTLYYLGYVYENLRRYPEALDAYTRAYEASGRANQDLKSSIDRVSTLVKQ